MQRIVGIGEMVISNNQEDVIKTFALASCVALVAYSPLRKVGGMIHIALPNPLADKESIIRPYYYASTGIPKIINEICSQYGCLKGELEINLYGGADSIRQDDIFNIGRRNIEAVTLSLVNQNLVVNNKEIGGTVSRTIELQIATGEINVIYQPIKI